MFGYKKLSLTVLLFALFHVVSAKAQSVETQCVKTGPIVNCRSKVDDSSQNSAKRSQENWNKIYENQRRTQDAEDRIRQSEQRIAEMERKSKEDRREYLVFAMSSRNKMIYLKRFQTAFNEGRCSDAGILAIMWEDDAAFKKAEKSCKKSHKESRSVPNKNHEIPKFYTAVASYSEASEMSESLGFVFLNDLIEENDPDAIAYYSLLFSDGVFPYSAQKIYFYLRMSDYYYTKNKNAYPEYFGEARGLYFAAMSKSKEQMTLAELTAADNIIESCKIYGMKECRKIHNFYP